MTEVPIVRRVLSSDERVAMEQALELAARLWGNPLPLGFEHVQRIYDVFVRGKRRKETDEEAVIALGIAFGAAIIEKSGFDWVRVSDQWGDETCVGPPHKTIHCAPISMVQKRLARSEEINLAQLADTVIRSITEKVANGEVGDW